MANIFALGFGIHGFGQAGNRRFVWFGRSPPPSGMVFGAAGAAQSPKIGDSRRATNPCIENPSVISCPRDGEEGMGG